MKKRKKTAEVKARNTTIALELILFAFAIFAAYTDTAKSGLYDGISITILGLLLLIMGELCYKLLLISYRQEGEWEESKILVDDNLSTETMLKVVLIKNDEYKKDFFIDLATRAQFYAIIEEEKVEIFIQYNGEENYIPFEELEKEYFNYYYRVKEKQ